MSYPCGPCGGFSYGYNPCFQCPSPCPPPTSCFNSITSTYATISNASICTLTGLCRASYTATVSQSTTANTSSSLVGTIVVPAIVAPGATLTITVTSSVVTPTSIILASTQSVTPAIGTSVGVTGITSGSYILTFTNLDTVLSTSTFTIGFMIL